VGSRSAPFARSAVAQAVHSLPAENRPTMNRRSFALVGIFVLALSCRDALGIDGLGPRDGDATGASGGGGQSASGAAGRAGSDGGAGDSGEDASKGAAGKSGHAPKGEGGAGGTAGEPGAGAGGVGGVAAGAGGAGGTAAGAGGAGGAGAGGSVGSPSACQQACVYDSSASQVDEYFDTFAGCACADGDEYSCVPLCGSCDIDASTFDGESAACIECIALNAISTACASTGCESGGCDMLRECLAECSE
jgi:hypothetical protein